MYKRIVSCQMNNAYGKPSPKAIWATTALGDVFVYDPALTEVIYLYFNIFAFHVSILQSFLNTFFLIV